MTDVIEEASTGRAKCRACGQPTPKGELRFGERVPNPFAEGEAELTYWFHVPCAAYRRCERFVTLTPEQLAGVSDAATLGARASFGALHHRVPRITGLERAKSGRAKCRHCKEVIAGEVPRIVLSIWEEGRFAPMGFVHLTCAPAYFETPEIRPWLEFVAPDAVRNMEAELKAALLSFPSPGQQPSP